MSKFNTVALVTAGLVAAMTAMSVPAAAEGGSPEAVAAARAKAAHVAKARAKIEAAKRREIMAQMAMLKGQGMPGMGLPVAIPSMGECKLDLKHWQASVSRLIKEEC